MKEAPGDDRPRGQRPVLRDDGAAPTADAGDLNDPRNPMAIAAAFYNTVMADDGPNPDVLRFLCTPESWPAWGDFSEVRRAHRPAGAG
jgi:hypothetical protein